jgi:hypothetical protein
MPGRKPWHDSPYDASGMPLGVETADYDNEEERRKHMVKEKYVPEIPLNDPEYQPKQMPKTFTGQRPLTKKNFNSAISEGVGLEDPNVERVDVEDPGARRELLVREADDKGFTETPELPKVEKQETVDEIGAQDERNPESETHQEELDKKKEDDDIDASFLDDEKDEDNDGVSE